jgi:hypothetical protein
MHCPKLPHYFIAHRSRLLLLLMINLKVSSEINQLLLYWCNPSLLANSEVKNNWKGKIKTVGCTDAALYSHEFYSWKISSVVEILHCKWCFPLYFYKNQIIFKIKVIDLNEFYILCCVSVFVKWMSSEELLSAAESI